VHSRSWRSRQRHCTKRPEPQHTKFPPFIFEQRKCGLHGYDARTVQTINTYGSSQHPHQIRFARCYRVKVTGIQQHATRNTSYGYCIWSCKLFSAHTFLLHIVTQSLQLKGNQAQRLPLTLNVMIHSILAFPPCQYKNVKRKVWVHTVSHISTQHRLDHIDSSWN
jgi:hypothetical protein